MENWQEILQKFAAVRVLIVGDVMLDRYLWGTVSRISPEAPVPIVKLEKSTLTAGGAANVAANVAALGAQAFLIGAIGADDGGRDFPRVLREHNVGADCLVSFADRPTTTKTRVLAHQQQVVRIDEEFAAPLDDAQAALMQRKINEILPAVDIVILSDYAKGCLCDAVLSATIETARRLNKKILVDPKGSDYRKYRGATLLTPNKIEAAAAARIDITDEKSCLLAGEKILREVELESLLVTLGEDGMRLFQKNQNSAHFPAVARQVYDVTGAGDTVIATLAIALGANANLAAAAQIANAAAGLAVEQLGTATVKIGALADSIKNDSIKN